MVQSINDLLKRILHEYKRNKISLFHNYPCFTATINENSDLIPARLILFHLPNNIRMNQQVKRD